jgi:hypothetical protein
MKRGTGAIRSLQFGVQVLETSNPLRGGVYFPVSMIYNFKTTQVDRLKAVSPYDSCRFEVRNSRFEVPNTSAFSLNT